MTEKQTTAQTLSQLAEKFNAIQSALLDFEDYGKKVAPNHGTETSSAFLACWNESIKAYNQLLEQVCRHPSASTTVQDDISVTTGSQQRPDIASKSTVWHPNNSGRNGPYHSQRGFVKRGYNNYSSRGFAKRGTFSKRYANPNVACGCQSSSTAHASENTSSSETSIAAPQIENVQSAEASMSPSLHDSKKQTEE